MSDEVEDRQYGSDKLLCDVLQFWSEATNGWFAAMRGGGTDLPRIFFLLGPHTESDCREIDFFAPSCPQGPPEVAYLRPIVDGDSSQINEDKCVVCLSPRRNALVVHLDNLWRKGKPPLKKGFYQGMIHMGDEPIALLFVKVGEDRVTSPWPDMACPPDDVDAQAAEDAKRAARAKPKKKRRAKPKK
ncbi:MAG TPA: hypothetical protein VL049_23350 [Candidatus Dormibacteraeota bacterium]|nr:hypothetical protein [Candidatus Dormibacteraeota bacterium]